MLGFVEIEGIDTLTIKTPIEEYSSELGKRKNDEEFISIRLDDEYGRPRIVKTSTEGHKVHVHITSKNEIKFLSTHKEIGTINVIKDRRVVISGVETISMNETAITYVDKYGNSEGYFPRKKTDIITTKDGSTVTIDVFI